ncbi:hypothetical protein UB23_12425 [Pseudomonas sp. ES3-33]|nr:hypothetical protein UB23_12425 [Pseudomonas sp. ES3-33]
MMRMRVNVVASSLTRKKDTASLSLALWRTSFDVRRVNIVPITTPNKQNNASDKKKAMSLLVSASSREVITVAIKQEDESLMLDLLMINLDIASLPNIVDAKNTMYAISELPNQENCWAKPKRSLCR